MTELFERLYPQALASHIDPVGYWDLSLYEITQMIETANLEARRAVVDSYNLATMIALFVGASITGKQPPDFYELYPNLLTEEVTKEQEKAAMDFYKEQFKAFAAGRNAQRKESK